MNMLDYVEGYIKFTWIVFECIISGAWNLSDSRLIHIVPPHGSAWNTFGLDLSELYIVKYMPKK